MRKILLSFPSVRRLGAVFALVFALVSASQAMEMAAPKFSAMAIDARSGKVLFNHAGDSSRYPASLTKVMTVYMIFEALRDGRITTKTRILHTT